MIFRSELAFRDTDGEIVPAWDAVFGIQKAATPGDWFITQPDHARISGEIAAAFHPGKVPDVSPALSQAIAMHDLGWMPVDGDLGSPKAPGALPDGHALSFMDAPVEVFLRAWTGSIQAAMSTGPLGGAVVSAHFTRIGKFYLDRGAGDEAQRTLVQQFLSREEERQQRLFPQAKLSEEDAHALIDVLQFCDIASLVLCANVKSPVEFPQVLDGSKIRLAIVDGVVRMTPNLLDHVLILEIPCVRFAEGKVERHIVPVKVQ